MTLKPVPAHYDTDNRIVHIFSMLNLTKWTKLSPLLRFNDLYVQYFFNLAVGFHFCKLI